MRVACLLELLAWHCLHRILRLFERVRILFNHGSNFIYHSWIESVPFVLLLQLTGRHRAHRLGCFLELFGGQVFD
jgi:hypothetical protein